MKKNLIVFVGLISIGILLFAASSGPYSQCVSNMEDNIFNPESGGGSGSSYLEWLSMPVKEVGFSFILEKDNKVKAKISTDNLGNINVRDLKPGKYIIKMKLKHEPYPKGTECSDKFEDNTKKTLPDMKEVKDKRFSIFKLNRSAHVFSIVQTWYYKVVFYMDGEREGLKFVMDKKFRLNFEEIKLGTLTVPEGVKSVNIQGIVLRIY